MGAFSAFRDKRKKNKETPTVNDHYTKLARKSALVRYICIVLVVVFAVYSLSFHSDEISMENFRYMLKFINLGEEADAPLGTYIEFDGSTGNRGLIFKGDLAILDESGLTVTGWDGEQILRSVFSSDHPKITENGINLFCYDLGGKELRIFNSYSLLSTISFDYPIYGVSASKSGAFAVISAAKGYRSAIYVYDKEFRLLYSRMLDDEYTDFIDISDGGKEFITAAHYSEGGNIVTLVSKGRSDSDTMVYEQKFVGEIPLGIYYTDNGYCLMTSDYLRMFNSEDNLTGQVDFSQKDLLSGRIFGNKALMTYRLEGLSGGTEAVIYSLEGEELFSCSFETALTDSLIIGNQMYALFPGVLTVCDTETGEKTIHKIPTSYSSVLSDGSKAILLSENQAEYFDKTTFTEEN